MSKITINANEQYMIALISDLLDLKSSWTYHDGAGDMIQINFTGDYRLVQQAILHRLTIPARLRNMYQEKGETG